MTLKLLSSRLSVIWFSLFSTSYFPDCWAHQRRTCMLSHFEWLAVGWLMVCWCVKKWAEWGGPCSRPCLRSYRWTCLGFCYYAHPFNMNQNCVCPCPSTHSVYVYGCVHGHGMINGELSKCGHLFHWVFKCSFSKQFCLTCVFPAITFDDCYWSFDNLSKKSEYLSRYMNQLLNTPYEPRTANLM